MTFSDTAAKSTDSFFYQESSFVGYAHVQGMYPTKRILNKYEALFSTTVLKAKLKGQYDFVSKMTRYDILKLMILLPATPDGEPDWKYMEEHNNDKKN